MRRIATLLLVLTLVACESGERSPTETQRTLSGRVVEMGTNAALSAVRIAVQQDDIRRTMSGPDGSYRLSIGEGRLILTATKDGYHDFSTQIIPLNDQVVYQIVMRKLE